MIRTPGTGEASRRRNRRAVPAVAVLLGAVALVLLPAALRAEPSDFPNPEGLRTQVEFWKSIFTAYSENQILVHDSLHLDKIYSVIDLRPLAAGRVDDLTLWKTKKLKEKSEKARIDRILQNLDAARSPQALSSEERVIWDLFGDVNEPHKFRAARERVRAQVGLRERFQRGIEISRRYLPYMEEIFRREGLPIELTRLPFVESSFNVRAYSKVGAAGVWQFIPSAGRIYLRMNEAVDDRRDPLYATAGAARHLKDDYAVLGSWPLAITAYNHGRAGMARAVQQVGSRDIVDVVRRYNGKAFGFASRNFYAEFLAALDVERNYRQYFGDLPLEPKLRYEEVVIPDYVRFSTLARLAGVGVNEFADLNPSFAAPVIDGKLYVPKGYKLRVPPGRAAAFRLAYAKLPPGERFASQRRYYVQHRVTKGQTLGAIARRYRTTVKKIQFANNLRDARRLRVGQVLKIPTG